MARNTMAALITRERLLINDPTSPNQQFTDDDIQAVMDESREDVVNRALMPRPTFVGASIQYLNYYAEVGNWEDDVVFKQYLTTPVTPSASEPIAGHWTFATTTLPPIYITGKTYDIYRAAADLLERWAARWVLSYNVSVDGQSLQRGQAAVALQTLAETYRRQARAHVIRTTRSDVASVGQDSGIGLGPTAVDYMARG